MRLSTPSNAKTPTAKTPATPAQNPDGCPAGTTIPQGGGDQDGDNSGGASDGAAACSDIDSSGSGVGLDEPRCACRIEIPTAEKRPLARVRR
jgi:hypothetical protein